MKRDIDAYDRTSLNLLRGVPAQWLADLRHLTAGNFSLTVADIGTGLGYKRLHLDQDCSVYIVLRRITLYLLV